MDLGELAEKIEELVLKAAGTVETINGRKYWKTDDKIVLIEDEISLKSLSVKTLAGLIDYINKDPDKLNLGFDKRIVHVEGPTSVKLYTNANLDNTGKRQLVICAEPLLPQPHLNRFISQEDFMIMLKSCFVPDAGDIDQLLKLASSITEDSNRTAIDDGISQIVTVRQGVSMKTEVALPGEVFLAPFRTFVEVDQPASRFVFRVKEGPQLALFEADGGAWRNEAINNILSHLEANIETGDQEPVDIIA